MTHNDDNWIGLIHGVKDLEFNSKLEVYLNTRTYVYI